VRVSKKGHCLATNGHWARVWAKPLGMAGMEGSMCGGRKGPSSLHLPPHVCHFRFFFLVSLLIIPRSKGPPSSTRLGRIPHESGPVPGSRPFASRAVLAQHETVSLAVSGTARSNDCASFTIFMRCIFSAPLAPAASIGENFTGSHSRDTYQVPDR